MKISKQIFLTTPFTLVLIRWIIHVTQFLLIIYLAQYFQLFLHFEFINISTSSFRNITPYKLLLLFFFAMPRYWLYYILMLNAQHYQDKRNFALPENDEPFIISIPTLSIQLSNSHIQTNISLFTYVNSHNHINPPDSLYYKQNAIAIINQSLQLDYPRFALETTLSPQQCTTTITRQLSTVMDTMDTLVFQFYIYAVYKRLSRIRIYSCVRNG